MNSRKSWQLKLSKESIENIVRWASHSENCLYLDSHQHQDPYGRFDRVLAWGSLNNFELKATDSIEDLYDWHHQIKDWAFGHLNYELKSKSEGIKSQHADPLNWSLASFFRPKHLLYLKRGETHWTFESTSLKPDDLRNLKAQSPKELIKPKFKSLISRDEYLKDVQSLINHIQYGNIYEINYCQTFEAKGKLNPLEFFLQKNEEHQAPFTAFYRHGHQYALSFTPERYLTKEGSKIISQPIKGTAARHANQEADSRAKAELWKSEKERAENVMIVDLVRNDLSRTAAKDSVKVDELFGLYSFNAVHQMISTVSSELDTKKYHWLDAIRHSFPMGSMTGAPKYSAMKLIDQHEHFNRGLYSGSIGYIDPQGNFDFSVIIRTLLYHAQKECSRVAVGSAITIHCNPEAEYEECLLKAEKLIG